MISGCTMLNASMTGLNGPATPESTWASYIPWRSMMMPKTIVVAPTTAVPMSTGLAVALKVLPAPSFFSSRCLAFSKSGLKPKLLSISLAMFGSASMRLNSYTDCALSVTGP